MDPQSQSARGEQHVYLLGRPPLEADLGYLKTQTIEGRDAEVGILAAEWRAANDRIQELEQSEAGAADSPRLEGVPDELQASRAALLADPTFRAAYGIVPSDVQIVGLDDLVVFQKHINLEYVRALQASMPPTPSLQDLFTFALALSVAQPPVRFQQVANNSFVFTSPSNDFRFLEAEIVDPARIEQYVSGGFPTSVIALALGYGTNYLSALLVENRLVLNNGSHRAYALRDLGIRNAPCVVQRVTRREELGVVARGDLQQSPERFLTAPRPPLLKDYFDDQLRKLVTVPPLARQVRIQFGVEQLDVPE